MGTEAEEVVDRPRGRGEQGMEHTVCRATGQILRVSLSIVGAWAFTLSKMIDGVKVLRHDISVLYLMQLYNCLIGHRLSGASAVARPPFKELWYEPGQGMMMA